MKKSLITISLILAGVMLMFAFNYLFLEPIIIPDPCYYHNRDTGLLFNLFYDLPAIAGGHPVPTIFNLLLTLITGVISGRLFAKFLNKKYDTLNGNAQHVSLNKP